MKQITVLSVTALLGLAACDTMNRPINSSGFDPLVVPGGGGQRTQRIGFKAHDLVIAAMDNTAFFKRKPKDSGEADKLLPRGTGMKVIRNSGSFLEVELDATGEVGYVPEVMVESATPPAGGPLPGTGETQVYPPLPIDGQIPGDGSITPAPEPPGGTIPTMIDPNRPADPPPQAPEAPAAVPGTPTPTPATPPVPAPPAGDTPPSPPPVPAGFPDPVPPVQPKDEPAKPKPASGKPAEQPGI